MLLSLATVVKLSNAVIAAALLVVLAWLRSRRDALTFLAGAVTFAPVALVGAWWLRRRPSALALLAAVALANAAFYTVYEPTAIHPRFLYVSLPPLFVLWSAGVFVLTGLVRRNRLVH